MKYRALAVLAVACLLAPAAHAGGFIGAAAGQSSIDSDVGFKADDTAWKILGGYNFIRYFGVEGDYADMGTFSESEAGMEFSTDLTGFGVFARGIIPLGSKVELYGKLGMVFWQADTAVNINGTTFSDSDSGNDLAFGAGAAFILAKRFSLQLEYEMYDIDSETDTNLASLGFTYRF